MKELIKGCRKRHRESQKKLYENYYAYGMSITLRYAGSRNEAGKILNDAFMKVFTQIEKYDPKRPFKPWLRRILINTAINHYRKNASTPQWEDLESAGGAMAVEESITGGIAYKDIIRMVQQLSPAYRTVFNLHVIEGYTHREIAEMLDIAEGTSKSNLSKAKSNLQVMLEKNFKVTKGYVQEQ